MNTVNFYRWIYRIGIPFFLILLGHSLAQEVWWMVAVSVITVGLLKLLRFFVKRGLQMALNIGYGENRNWDRINVD